MSPPDVNSPLTSNLPFSREQSLPPHSSCHPRLPWGVMQETCFRHFCLPSIIPLMSLLLTLDSSIFYLFIYFVKITQLCLTLCDPMYYRVHGILQARILEWVAFLFSRGSSWLRDRTQVSHIAGGFLTNWAIREVLFSSVLKLGKRRFQKPVEYSPAGTLCWLCWCLYKPIYVIQLPRTTPLK